MGELNLRIDVKGAAFADDPGLELARILMEAAEHIRECVPGQVRSMFDANGNNCGTWSYRE